MNNVEVAELSKRIIEFIETDEHCRMYHAMTKAAALESAAHMIRCTVSAEATMTAFAQALSPER